MNIIVSFEIRFKTNKQRIIDILNHFSFKRIQDNLYFKDINNDELYMLQNEIMENIREYDSLIIIPLCKSCYEKKSIIGRNLNFADEPYRIF